MDCPYSAQMAQAQALDECDDLGNQTIALREVHSSGWAEPEVVLAYQMAEKVPLLTGDPWVSNRWWRILGFGLIVLSVVITLGLSALLWWAAFHHG